MQVPSGTVTFLFTDIEGSTRLARELVERWESVRSRHHEILRAAIEQNHGFVFQIIGDAFCASFFRAADALKAAVQAQQGLAAEAWGETVVRVRMGIHTGEAESAGQEYRGYITMSMVQRLMSAGHGGQVLVSGTAESLLRGQLPEKIALIDLGRHHFKDVPQTVRVFQVEAPGLQKEFPPVRTIDSHPNNLPTQLTSFVGREKERADIRRLLHNTHMLTLIGPGGTGKTRLSIQAATEMLDQFPDGVWLVELAPILDPALVPRTAAITIGLRDEPQRPIIDMLCDYLHEKKMLLVLDNCEHIVEACARMADRILRGAPGVLILASSREALGIGGEVTYRVPSLGLPDLSHLPSLEILNQYEAVRLFIDRATSADPSFTVTNSNAPAVAQICHRLDGIPLAIELAAAKTRVLDAGQIAKRLDDRFKLLTGGSRTAMERHQTLRATIDWSYNLLPFAEQILFRRLSIFVDGWTLEACEAVCSDQTVQREDVLELLEQLINKSVVIRYEVRYRMLETIRLYANEKLLEAGEANMLRDRHLDYFINLAEAAEPHLIRSEQVDWLPVLDADLENLRAALEWALGKEEALPSLRLCAALGHFWNLRGYLLEGTHLLAKALAKPAQEQDDQERAARARAFYRDSQFAESLDDIKRMEYSARSSLALLEHGSNELDTAIARFMVGFSLYRKGESVEARELVKQSLVVFERLDQSFWQAYADYWLREILLNLNEINESQFFNPNLMDLARKSGERIIMANALLGQAYWHYVHAQVEKAMEYVEQADALSQQIGQVINISFPLAVSLAWLTGDTQRAKSILLEQEQRLGLLGEKYMRSNQMTRLGRLALEGGEYNQARTWLKDALKLKLEMGDTHGKAMCLADLGVLDYLEGNTGQFKQTLRECLNLAKGMARHNKIHLLTILISCPYFQQPENSLPFLGVIEFQGRQLESPIDPLRKRYYDAAEKAARAVMGDDAFETACAEGAKLSIDDALNLIMQKVEEL